MKIKYISDTQELDYLSGKYPLTWSEMMDSGLTSYEIDQISKKWKLTKRQKRVMIYYYLERKTQQEIADILHLDQSVISRHIKYLKKKILKSMHTPGYK
jgi:RNA polymerase sigma factor (sigma-70 family)